MRFGWGKVGGCALDEQMNHFSNFGSCELDSDYTLIPMHSIADEGPCSLNPLGWPTHSIRLGGLSDLDLEASLGIRDGIFHLVDFLSPSFRMLVVLLRRNDDLMLCLVLGESMVCHLYLCHYILWNLFNGFL